MEASLVGNEALFLSFSTVADFAGCIGKGFKYDGEKKTNNKNFIKNYCDDFHFNNYRVLQNKIKMVVKTMDVKSAFKKVVLLSNTPLGDERYYEWNMFDLSENTFKCGKQFVSCYPGGYVDPYSGDPKPEDFMKALIQE